MYDEAGSEYMPRLVDRLLREKLETMPAVLVRGPKWCGKTSTCEQVSASELKLRTVIIAKAAVLILCHLPLNTLVLSFLMNMPYLTLLMYRAAVLVPFAVIEVAIITAIKKPLLMINNKLLKR